MTDASTQERPVEVPVLRRGGFTAFALLLIGLAACAVMVWGFAADPGRAFHSYLTAYAFVLCLMLGCMGLVMITHAANASWPVAVRRLCEAAAGGMPLMGILFVPVPFGVDHLYPWRHASHYEGVTRHVLVHRQPFMNAGFFVGRAALYLLVWSVFAWLLRGWSLASDQGRDAQRQHVRLRRLSYVGLPLVATTAAFAAFEWLMSLAPEFSSSMYGTWWISMCLFGGTAWTIVLTVAAQRAEGLGTAGPSHLHALGRLLLAFLIFLGYTSYFQFMLVWIADKPSEAAWYSERAHGAYYWISIFLVLGHFFLTLFLLLPFGLKRKAGPLAGVALWGLFSLYLHLHWAITASSEERGFVWLDLVAVLAVLGVVVSFGLWLQRGKALAPVGDPSFRAALAYESR